MTSRASQGYENVHSRAQNTPAILFLRGGMGGVGGDWSYYLQYRYHTEYYMYDQFAIFSILLFEHSSRK